MPNSNEELTYTDSYYALFASCLPGNEAVQKRNNIFSIQTTLKKQRLGNADAIEFLTQSDAPYNDRKLQTYSADQIARIRENLTLAIDYANILFEYLRYGDASKLKNQPKPDFTDKSDLSKSLSQLKKLLTDFGRSKQNITNIHPKNAMKLFEEDTVCSIEGLEGLISKEEEGKLEKALFTAFMDRAFCIGRDEANDWKEQMDKRIQAIESTEEVAVSGSRTALECKLCASGAYLAAIISMALTNCSLPQIGAFAVLPGIALLLLWMKG